MGKKGKKDKDSLDSSPPDGDLGDILSDLERGFYKRVFKDRAAFSILLRDQEKFLISQLDHPDEALEQVIELPLTEPQMAFLLRSLVRMWSKKEGSYEHENWPELKKLVESRADRFERRTVLYLVDEESSEPVVFEDIEEQLQSLGSAERAQYLTDTVTSWGSTAPRQGHFWAKAFTNTLVVRCLRKYEELVHGQVPPIPLGAPMFTDSFEKKPAAKQSITTASHASLEESGPTEGGHKRFTSRQAVLLFSVLAFGRLQPPQDVLQKDVAECIQRLTGYSLKNLTDFVRNPVAVKADSKEVASKKSARVLCNDLHIVRAQLERLGLSEGVRQAVQEIDFLLSDLETEAE